MFTLLLLFGDFVLLDVICVDFVSSDVSLFGNVFGFVYKYWFMTLFVIEKLSRS